MLLGRKIGRRGQARRGDRRVPAGAATAPELKVQALLHAGLSFKANGVNKLAERNFEDAIRLVDAQGHRPPINELHYNLGLLAEEQGNKSIAEEHYNEVAANDYSYRDVAQTGSASSREKPPEED